MKRRHLFDNGHPVCAGTLVAGARVLLAVSNQSLRHSRRRLVFSRVALANGAETIVASLALCRRTTAAGARGQVLIRSMVLPRL